MKTSEFLSKIDTTGPCWIWCGYLNPFGYGRIRFRGKRIYVHRLYYEMFKGPIPEGMVLDHLCFNPACVRPDHLAVVTNQENARRQRSAMKPACVNGHSYDERNTYRRPDGSRDCRACILSRVAKYQRNRAAREKIGLFQSAA